MRSLVEGPSVVQGFEWHQSVGSTNVVAAAAAEAGAPEVHVVAADVQTEGRGRLGRAWQAPPGTSLMCSWMLRPTAGVRRALIPLMTGLALAQTAGPHCPGVPVGLKWPNDLMLGTAGDERKAAGILVEAPLDGVVVVGTGVNVDWRGVERPDELALATSLSEVAGTQVDRWSLFAGLAGVLTRRYAQLQDDPDGLLDAYRSYCLTLGRQVRVERIQGAPVEGTAERIDPDGALVVTTASGPVVVHAGDVHHVRGAATR